MAIKEEKDIVLDILWRVQEIVGPIFLSHQNIEDLELDIKSDWGGSEIWVDTGKSLRLVKRNYNLIRRWDAGASRKELREKFGISDKTIQRILKEYHRT